MTSSNRLTPARTFRTGAALLLAASALAVAGCEQHPYPTPAPDESAPPPPPPGQLMGAPEGAGPPPPAPRAFPPAPGYGPPVQPMGRAPCAPDPQATGPNAPTVIICSTPVPNPPEHEGYAGRRHHHHHGHRWMARHGHPHHHRGWSAHPTSGSAHHRMHRRVWVQGGAAPWTAQAHAHHHHHHLYGVAAPAVVHRHGVSPATPHVTTAPVVPPRATHHVHVVKPAIPALAPVARPTVHKSKSAAPATSEATISNTVSNTVTNTTAATTPADRYGALQSALAAAVGREGKLATPAHFEAGQATAVSLTLPADFAQTVQTDAAQQGLADAAASVNMTSTLTGDGYTIAPDEPQSQPLMVGQPIVFRWKVTPLANQTMGPLQASVSADLLSQGRSLPLGTLKSAGASNGQGRLVGLGLLAIIAAVVIGWAVNRRRPTPTGASRPRANHENGAA